MGDNPELWLTYDEAAARLGIKPDSVRRRAAAKKWPKRQGNDGLARVRIDPDLIRTVTPAPTPAVIPDESGPLREELAASKAEIAGLQARLDDAKADRDAWRDRAERLDDRIAELSKPRPSIFERIFGRN